ncbi:MAG: hypothetical protein Q9195_005326 [Heterodermia aff. obscurata]
MADSSSSAAVPADLHPIKAAFLEWRKQRIFAKFWPVDMEHLSKMPPCVLYWTPMIEKQLGKKIDPEQGYWLMQHWLEKPYVPPPPPAPVVPEPPRPPPNRYSRTLEETDTAARATVQAFARENRRPVPYTIGPAPYSNEDFSFKLVYPAMSDAADTPTAGRETVRPGNSRARALEDDDEDYTLDLTLPPSRDPSPAPMTRRKRRRVPAAEEDDDDDLPPSHESTPAPVQRRKRRRVRAAEEEDDDDAENTLDLVLPPAFAAHASTSTATQAQTSTPATSSRPQRAPRRPARPQPVTPAPRAPRAPRPPRTNPQGTRSASKAHFYDLRQKGIWQAGDALRVPLWHDEARQNQRGHAILTWVGNTAGMTKATDWDCTIGGAFIGHLRGVKSPTEFVQEFETMALIGPKARNWSSEVHVLRNGQDQGCVTQFKDANNVVQYNLH